MGVFRYPRSGVGSRRSHQPRNARYGKQCGKFIDKATFCLYINYMLTEELVAE
jgi:hypothetical protein